MPLTDLERVRSLIGDMTKSAILEDVARGDGSTAEFQLDMFPVVTASLTVYSTGAAISASANIALGTFQTTNSAPAAGNVILASYRYQALSDQEIQSIIDSVSGSVGDRLMLAASIGCRAIAANYARFFAYTQGDKSVDKNKQADKLRELAESYESAWKTSLETLGKTLTVMEFDDSGTEFDGYDTAIASLMTSTS